jgi:hypothetical protein
MVIQPSTSALVCTQRFLLYTPSSPRCPLLFLKVSYTDAILFTVVWWWRFRLCLALQQLAVDLVAVCHAFYVTYFYDAFLYKMHNINIQLCIWKLNN